MHISRLHDSMQRSGSGVGLRARVRGVGVPARVCGVGLCARVRRFLHSSFCILHWVVRASSPVLRSAPRTAQRRDTDVAARPRLAQDVRSLGKSVQPAPSVAEGFPINDTDGIWYPAHERAVLIAPPLPCSNSMPREPESVAPANGRCSPAPLVRLGPGGDFTRDIGGAGVPARDDDNPTWIPGRPGGPLGPAPRGHRSYGGGIILGLVLMALTFYLTIPRIAEMCR